MPITVKKDIKALKTFNVHSFQKIHLKNSLSSANREATAYSTTMTNQYFQRYKVDIFRLRFEF